MSANNPKPAGPLFLATALFLASSSSSLAQDVRGQDGKKVRAPHGIEEVIVSARKRDESIQDIPLSVTPFSEQQIERRGISGMEDLAASTPGFTYEGFITAGTNGNAVIRGLAQQFTTSRIQNVAFFIDGVYMQRQSMLNMGLLDMQRVEIVKGPQNAVYGRNAFAGAVNNITKRPTVEPGGSIGVTLGSDERRDVKFTYTGPIYSDKLLAKFSAGYTEYDGHTKNDHPQKDANPSGPNTRGNIGGHEDSTVALALTWDASERMAMHLNMYRTEIERENGNGYLLGGVNAQRFGLITAEQNDLNCNQATVNDIGNPSVEHTGFTAFCGELPSTPDEVSDRTIAGNVIDPRGIGAIAETDLATFAFDYELTDSIRINYLFGWADHNSSSTAGSGAEDPVRGQRIEVNTNATATTQMPTSPIDSHIVLVNTTSSRPVSELSSTSHEFRFDWDLNEKIVLSGGVYYSKVKDEQFNIIYISPLCNSERPENCEVSYEDSISPIISERDPTDRSFVVVYDQGLRQHGAPNEHTKFQDQVRAFFTAINYDYSDTITGSLELRYTEETNRIERITDAFAIRDGEVITYNTVTDPVFSFGDINCGTPDGPSTVTGDIRICDLIVDATDSETFYYFTPRAIVEWEWQDGSMLYASAAKGVKAGGFNNASSVEEQTYDPAENWTIEVGSKNSWFDRTLILNAAVFFIDWKDLQGGQPPSIVSLSSSDITNNVGDAESIGIEVESTWLINNHFSTDIGFTYNDASYKDGVIYSPGRGSRDDGNPLNGEEDTQPPGSVRCDGVVCPVDGSVGGNQLARTSKVQASIGFNANTSINGWLLSGRIDANYQSKQFVTPLNLAWVPERTITNISANLTSPSDDWEFNFFGKNILDEDVAANSFYIGVFNHYLVGKIAGPSYGLSAKYNF